MTVYDLLDAAHWFQSLHIAETRSLFLHATSSPRESHMMPVPNSSMWRFSPTQVSQMEGWTHLRNIGRHRSNRTLRQDTGCPLSGILTSRRWEEELKAWVLSMSTGKAMESHRQCCWLTVPTTQSSAIDQMATLIQPKKTAFSVWGRRSKAGLLFSNKLSNRFHVVLEIKSWKVQELELMQLCSLDLFWQLPLKPMNGWHPATWPEVRKDWGTGQWSVKRRNLGGCSWRLFALHIQLPFGRSNHSRVVEPLAPLVLLQMQYLNVTAFLGQGGHRGRSGELTSIVAKTMHFQTKEVWVRTLLQLLTN